MVSRGLLVMLEKMKWFILVDGGAGSEMMDVGRASGGSPLLLLNLGFSASLDS
jgi:hypothetical protein